MKKTTGLSNQFKSKLKSAVTCAALTSVSIVGLNSCGLFEKKSEKKNDNQTEEPKGGDGSNDQLPLTSPSPTPVPSAAPAPSAEPTAAASASPSAGPVAIKFSNVAATLETTCGLCHANSQAPILKTFADYQLNRDKVLSELESKAMPPFLMSGEDPSLWTSSGEGKQVLEYFKQSGELVP